jgi:DNA replication protein
MAACKRYYSTKFIRMLDMLLELQSAREDGTFSKVLAKYTKPVLLIIDEWLLIKLNEQEARNLFEVISKRRKRSSTIFCSRFLEEGWYNWLGGE